MYRRKYKLVLKRNLPIHLSGRIVWFQTTDSKTNNVFDESVWKTAKWKLLSPAPTAAIPHQPLLLSLHSIPCHFHWDCAPALGVKQGTSSKCYCLASSLGGANWQRGILKCLTQWEPGHSLIASQLLCLGAGKICVGCYTSDHNPAVKLYSEHLLQPCFQTTRRKLLKTARLSFLDWDIQ